MTKAQVELLLRLIDADRKYRTRIAEGIHASPDERGIEIIWQYNGVHMRTANSLVDAGLAEISDSSINKNKWIFLGKSNPYDEIN